jgi:hypothetical protein
VIATAPEVREKTAKQQMIPFFITSGKPRLFPTRSFSIPAETFGRQKQGYLTTLRDAPEVATEKQALFDTIMTEDLKRSGHSKYILMTWFTEKDIC